MTKVNLKEVHFSPIKFLAKVKICYEYFESFTLFEKIYVI
jgi:hypothetical protein